MSAVGTVTFPWGLNCTAVDWVRCTRIVDTLRYFWCLQKKISPLTPNILPHLCQAFFGFSIPNSCLILLKHGEARRGGEGRGGGRSNEEIQNNTQFDQVSQLLYPRRFLVVSISLILWLNSRWLTRKCLSFSSKGVYVISQWDYKMDVSEITWWRHPLNGIDTTLLSWGGSIARALESTWEHGVQGVITDISIFRLTSQGWLRLLRWPFKAARMQINGSRSIT